MPSPASGRGVERRLTPAVRGRWSSSIPPRRGFSIVASPATRASAGCAAIECHDARPESIDINESCETFRRAPKEIWAVVARAFTAAAKHPSHSIAHVRPAHAGDTRCLARYQPFDSGDGGWFIATSKQAFSPRRVDALKNACGKGTTVNVPETMDTGN